MFRNTITAAAIMLCLFDVQTNAQIPFRSAPGANVVPTYTLTDIGVLPGFTEMEPSALNIRGDVVGTAYNQVGFQHAFLYSCGKLIDLGTLVGQSNPSHAAGINAEREVIGTFFDASGSHGFIYWAGRIRTIDISKGSTSLRAINDIGQIVGNSGSPTSLTGYAFLRQPNGAIVRLPNLGGGVYQPNAINNIGQIAGTEWMLNSPGGYYYYANHAVLVEAGGRSARDLGDLGGPSLATALNIKGQAVGYSLASYNHNPLGDPDSAVLYAGGKVTNLGLPSNEAPSLYESYGLAINDYGQIVGLSDLTFNSEEAHGLVYLNGQMYDLNDLLAANGTIYTITEGVGINDRGQILATARDGSGSFHAILLTPQFPVEKKVRD